jgi:hypothetical protein
MRAGGPEAMHCAANKSIGQIAKMFALINSSVNVCP